MPESHVPVRKSSWRGGNHFLLPWFRLGSRFLVAMTLLLILVPLLLRLFQKAKVDDLGGRDRPRHIGTFADQIDTNMHGFRSDKSIFRDYPHELVQCLVGHLPARRFELFHDDVQHLILISFIPNKRELAQGSAYHLKDFFGVVTNLFLRRAKAIQANG